MNTPLTYFSGLTGPRVERTGEHRLDDIIFIVIASVIYGAEGWNDMEEVGKSKEEWPRSFLQLPNGIPSHDTFNRLFSALNPEELEKCFVKWTRSVAHLCEHKVIPIDGKSMCGTRDAGNKSIVHMGCAWADRNHIVLGKVKVDEKNNEITVLPRLLDLLVIKGCIVTIDAMGSQKDVAAKVIEKEADYLLALKGNQGNLLEQVEDSFRF
jgi:hypothetical protein